MDYSMDEQTLLVDLIGGDEKAFCKLYVLYKNRLIYYILRFVKSKDYAEDIYQDIFASIWKNRRFLNPNTPIASYLYVITRNRVLNQMRTLAHEREFQNYILSHAIDYTDNTSETIQLEELTALIEKAVSRLTPRQREVFNMSWSEHLSHGEIARKLDLSIITVQQHLSASLHIIRDFLRDNSYSMALIFFLVGIMIHQ